MELGLRLHKSKQEELHAIRRKANRHNLITCKGECHRCTYKALQECRKKSSGPFKQFNFSSLQLGHSKIRVMDRVKEPEEIVGKLGVFSL